MSPTPTPLVVSLSNHEPRARPSTSSGRAWLGSFHQAVAHDGLADDDPLGPADAGERAELRVAALDQLAEARRVQTRRRGTAPLRPRKLADVTLQRAALHL